MKGLPCPESSESSHFAPFFFFAPSRYLEDGDGAGRNKHISEKSGQDLLDCMLFGIGTLVGVEVSARGKTPHSCAKTPIISVVIFLPGLAGIRTLHTVYRASPAHGYVPPQAD